MKQCPKCSIEKNASNTYPCKDRRNGLRTYCRTCDLSFHIPKRIKPSPGKKRCTTCGIEKETSFFCKKKLSKDGLESRCKICERSRASIYGEINRSRRTEKELARYHSDPQFRAIKHARLRIKNFLKNKDKKPSSSIGCTFEEFKQHLESLFQPGMSWENYGKWHIDHKYPLSVAYKEGPESFKKLAITLIYNPYGHMTIL